MGKYSKAKMFNRKAAKQSSKPVEILTSLNLQPGQTIADIGSGGGLFSLLFAQAVGPKGMVFAVDTNKDFLEFIAQQAAEKGIDNIKTIPATERSIPLPPHSMDVVFVRNVYHHLTNRVAYFTMVKKLLQPAGKVVIIEYSRAGSRFSFHRRCGHNVPKEHIIEEMKQAGYAVSASYDFLPVQSFTVFTPDD
jgi:arsenite methyltransferase